MPDIRYVKQNLFLAYVMLDKTYSRHRLCLTKPIPGIRYVGQNHMGGLFVKICKTRCFPSKKIEFFKRLLAINKNSRQNFDVNLRNA